jgi:hypothetical protein
MLYEFKDSARPLAAASNNTMLYIDVILKKSMKNKSLTSLLLIFLIQHAWTQNTNLDFKNALKLSNLTSFEEQTKSRRIDDTSSYYYITSNTTLQILHPTVSFQWKSKKHNFHEIELTSLAFGKNSTKTEIINNMIFFIILNLIFLKNFNQ